MRYRGQGHEIMVTVPDRVFGPEDGATFAEWFAEAYQGLFSRIIPNLSVEVLTWTLSLATERVAAETVPPQAAKGRAEPESTRKLFDPASGAWVEAGVYSRSALQPGSEVPGPAIIVEDETTTLVTNGFGATVNALGQIIMKKEGASA
jgi:N-methylhydantoinase A